MPLLAKVEAICFMVLACTASIGARGAIEKTCAAYLGLPHRYEAQFNMYKELRYIPPLSKVEEEASLNVLKLKISTPFDYYPPLRIWVEANLSMVNAVQELSIEKFGMSQQIAPELGWRIALAHLLKVHPSASTIHLRIYNDTYQGSFIARLLAEGLDAKQAVQQTAAFAAMAAYGFQLKSAALLADPYRGVGITMTLAR